MGSPTTKTNYHEKNKSGKRRSQPAFPPPRPSPPAEAGAPGSGTAASGAWRGRVWAPQGPARSRGYGKNPVGTPAGGGGAGTSLSARFHTPGGPRVPTRLAACALPPPGLLVRPLGASISAPPSAPQPGSLPAFQPSVPSSRPGPRSPSRRAAQTHRQRPGQGPVQPGPGAG